MLLSRAWDSGASRNSVDRTRKNKSVTSTLQGFDLFYRARGVLSWVSVVIDAVPSTEMEEVDAWWTWE
jgi:hypothetical protein